MQLLLNLALITSMFTFNLVHLIEAALYKDDPCLTKSEVGLCKPWAECPTIKNLLESGAYKLKEVENCGYDVKEEIICCPGLRTYVKISDTTDRTGIIETTTRKVFWLDLITKKNPHFSLDLLEPKIETLLQNTPSMTANVNAINLSPVVARKPLIMPSKQLAINDHHDFSELLRNRSAGEKRIDGVVVNIASFKSNTNSPDLSAGPVNTIKKNDNWKQKNIANKNRLQEHGTENVVSINQRERSRQSEMPPTVTGKRNGESSNESRNNETTVINEKNIDDLIRQVFTIPNNNDINTDIKVTKELSQSFRLDQPTNNNDIINENFNAQQMVGMDFAQKPPQTNGKLFNSDLEKPIISDREFLKIFGMARQEQQIREQEQRRSLLTSNSSTHIPNAPMAQQDLQQQQQVRKRPRITNPLNAKQLSGQTPQTFSDQVTQRQRIQNQYGNQNFQSLQRNTDLQIVKMYARNYQQQQLQVGQLQQAFDNKLQSNQQLMPSAFKYFNLNPSATQQVSHNIDILFNNPMFRSLQRPNVKLYGLQRSPQTKGISQNNEMFPATKNFNLTPSSTQRLSQNNSLLPNSQMFPLATQLFPEMNGFSLYSPVLSATHDFKFNRPATQQFALNKHISENNQMLPATHNFPLVPAVTQLFPHNNSFPPNAQVPPAIQSPTLSPTVQELFSQNNDFLSKADVQRTISNLNSNSSTNQQFALYKSTLESSQKVQKHMRKKFPYDAVVAQMLANQQQSEFQHINASSEIRTYPAQRTIRLWLGDNQVKFSSKSPSHLLIDPNYINHPQRLHNHTSYLLKQKIEFKNSSQMPQFIRQMLDNSLEKEVSATGVMIPNNQSLVDNFENNLTANRDNVSKQQPVESVGSEFQQFFSPKDHPKSRKVETKYRTEPILSIRPKNISVSDNSERAAIRACKKLETRERPAHLTPHILEGVPAALGEFPHMAGIGYSRSIGDDSPPYDVRCGGALISARFVLTAAHCVASRDNVPKAVVLGVVNFNDPEEMSAALQIKIKETHIHDNYTSSTTYNDIALLELEQDVEYSAFVYPSCLHIDENDPSESETLLVTGWGTVNTATRASSDILLKVNLDIKPLASCNEIFAKYGSDRRLTQGVIKTLLCAGDKEAKKDACSGDSGGPLNLVIDDSYRQYRIVGIVSSGFGCGTSIPGLYTRVALFLDYIEKIVWPDGVV